MIDLNTAIANDAALKNINDAIGRFDYGLVTMAGVDADKAAKIARLEVKRVARLRHIKWEVADGIWEG